MTLAFRDELGIPTAFADAADTAEKCMTSRKASRWIAGIAVSGFEDLDGQILDVKYSYAPLGSPIPMLAHHYADRVVGMVRTLTESGDRLTFTAQLCNDGSLPWADDAWEKIKCRSIEGISVRVQGRRNWNIWTVPEVSLTHAPKDVSARILRCYERDAAFRLDGKDVKAYWSEKDHGAPLPARLRSVR